VVVKKAIITSAGQATRMRPISNIVPKALLPVFKTIDGKKYSVPVIDLITESLRNAGASQFCFVVGAKGRMLMDYLSETNATYAIQKEPKGFADAVLKGEEFAGSDPFFLHSDDDFITGGYKEAIDIFDELEEIDCLCLLTKVEDPKPYGVVEVEPYKEMFSHQVFKIKSAEEKPLNPKSNFILSAEYIFTPKIFDTIRELTNEINKEVYVSTCVQKVIEKGGKVYGMYIDEKETWLTVGTPNTYFEALDYSYKNL
jgi:UTP--glucose-1-phosphate uridylyltransferase